MGLACGALTAGMLAVAPDEGRAAGGPGGGSRTAACRSKSASSSPGS